MRRRILAMLIFLMCGAVSSRAGGPAFVAGSGYSIGVEGQPMVWASGAVQYFTDQGSLSPILSGAQADALVAAGFSVWTTIPGVNLSATSSGHLAEDVSGSNIAAIGGVVTAPADIAPTATGTPVGVVYDLDGTVTDTLLGQGAGSLADCFTNAVYGNSDNFSASGNIEHALIVINGICAATAPQLPDVQYRLVRVIGRVLGLGWSQANVNVFTHSPPAVSADYAGLPVMHFSDPITCVPISSCRANAAVPKLDDIDSLDRLYPASVNPQPSGRVYGNVYFTDASGNAAQMMQGVNVVARLIDTTGTPSRQYVATSVSGFLFHGNAGNIVNGYVDANGFRYDRWGSNDATLEGFFDLGQLMIPTGQTIAQYQLSVEALDPNWSTGDGPYSPSRVTPSGAFSPIVVTVSNGSNAERDILMLGSEVATSHPGSGSTYTAPAALPSGGGWGSWISGYGSTDWFEFTAQANRTAPISVIAVDEAATPTESKLWPVIGVWQLSDQGQEPAPAATNFAFNTPTFGMSRLDAQFTTTDSFRFGIADFRGDGRPDYFYQAILLYSDSITPARLSLNGGVATLAGTGFNQGQQLSVSTAGGSSNGTMLLASASRIQASLPAASQDGVATVQVSDPLSGGFSQMIGALTYGAAATDLLLLLQGSEPISPAGAPAANPIRVRVVASDGTTPVSGATVAWSGTNSLQFSACGGATSCSLLSDEDGESTSLVTPTAAGQTAITITLAPASYSPPQTQQVTLLATSSLLDLVALTPTVWIAQGATLPLALTVRSLDLGVPAANVVVNFAVTNGTASLSASNVATNASGYASITANITNQSSTVQISACVAPNNSPCQMFTLFSTPSSLWKLEIVSGSSQFVRAGQTFQPLVLRITDGSATDNPVAGVNVTFNTTLTEINSGASVPGSGFGVMPILLGSSQTQVVSTVNGLASIVPSTGNVGPCDVFIGVAAGSLTAQFEMESESAIVAAVPKNSAPSEPAAKNTSHAAGSPPPSSLSSAAEALLAVPQAASDASSGAPEASENIAADTTTSETVAAKTEDDPQDHAKAPKLSEPAVPAHIEMEVPLLTFDQPEKWQIDLAEDPKPSGKMGADPNHP
jgi:hypothetical protein